jgi:hypothetical protein
MCALKSLDEREMREVYSFLVKPVPSPFHTRHRRIKSLCMQVSRAATKPPTFAQFRKRFGVDASLYKNKTWVKIQCGEWRSFQGLMETLHVKELREWMKGNPEFAVKVPFGPETKEARCKHIRWHCVKMPSKIHAKVSHCDQDIEPFLVALAELLSKE